MNKLLLLALPFLLALPACKTTEDLGTPPGVESVKIPNAPAELLRKAEQLPELTDPTMGGLVLDGTETDMKYNDVGFRYNKLIDLWVCTQDAVNNKKDINKCLNP